MKMMMNISMNREFLLVVMVGDDAEKYIVWTDHHNIYAPPLVGKDSPFPC